MPMFDYLCPAGHQFEAYHSVETNPVCRTCGLPTDRIWTSPPASIPDSVPGGFVIHNLDKEPRTFYSKSEYQAELRARGLTTDRASYKGDPGEGSDKPRNGLSRWI
jgi:hypothetical protein